MSHVHTVADGFTGRTGVARRSETTGLGLISSVIVAGCEVTHR